jgi:hypothetical protein
MRESLSPIDKIKLAYANTDTATLNKKVIPGSTTLEQILLRECLSQRYEAVKHLFRKGG